MDRMKLIAICFFVVMGISTHISEAQAKSVAQIYEHRDYQGKRQNLAPGKYRNMDNLNIGNDELSSFKLRKGYVIILYEHDNFQGKSYKYTESRNYIGDNFNDEVSSIWIRKKGSSGFPGGAGGGRQW